MQGFSRSVVGAVAAVAGMLGAVQSATAVTIDFNTGFTLSSYAGHANIAPLPNGNCPGINSAGCFYEEGYAIGIVSDASNPSAHYHRAGPVADRELAYHSDASGVYIRAVDGSAFSLQSMDFSAPFHADDNPDSGPNELWEIMGFNTALNPTLSTDATFPTRVAYRTVANPTDAVLNFDATFGNINAIWIVYKGYHQTPIDGKAFEVAIDDIVLGAAVPPPAVTVPLPAAGLLMLSAGLAGSGLFVGRRRKA